MDGTLDVQHLLGHHRKNLGKREGESKQRVCEAWSGFLGPEEGSGVRMRSKPLSLHVPHLEVDAVELVKAGPGSAGREPLEELGHGEVVERVGAVEHHTLRGGGGGEGVREEEGREERERKRERERERG